MIPVVPGEGDAPRSRKCDTFLQSDFWGRFKKSFGWKPLFFLDPDLLVLIRPLPGGYSLAYVPHAPNLSIFTDPGTVLTVWAADLAPYLPPGCLFLRFDPTGEYTPELKGALEGTDGLYKAPVDIQPPDTVVLPLTGTEEEILSGMKSKTRYNIRLAEKKGVAVVEGGYGDLDDWYRLYRETGRRDRISGHSPEYFRRLFDPDLTSGPDAPVFRLLFAEAEGERVAAVITCRYGEASTYMYGASSDSHRNLMPTYALQWYAMMTEREAGSRSYDLFGIPPADDPNHPMHGLWRFKVGFGGSIVHRPGCWDVPLKGALYRAYRAAEVSRNFYYKVIKKKTGI